MSTFSTTKSFEAASSFIPFAIERVSESFSAEGFEINQKVGSYNKIILELTKGDLVKKIVGLKQGLEISFESSGSSVNVEVKGTVIRDQLIASAITLFVTWPVLIPQIIGLIKQAGLDDKAMGIIESAHAQFTSEKPAYCIHCGGRVIGNPSVCPHCGAQLL